MLGNPVSRKILILTWPETSAYNATFRLARILSQRGYEIVYALPAHWQEYVARQGFSTHEITIQTQPEKPTHWLSNLLHNREQARQQIARLCESLEWVKSDGFSLILLHTNLWQYATALHRLGILSIAINPGLGSTWNLEIPPIFSPLQPLLGHRLLNFLQNGIAWLALRYFGTFNHRYHGVIQDAPMGFAGLAASLWAATRHFTLTLTEPLRMPVYYQQLRTARRTGIRIGWGDYGHRLCEPELVLGPKVVDFHRCKMPVSRIYAGACVDLQLAEEHFTWEQFDPQQPVIYCAIGSHGDYWNKANRHRLVGSVITAFKAHPEWQLLLQANAAGDLASHQPLPENIHVAAWFPQLQVLQRAALMISHGGFGTMREALYYGVPLAIFPFGVDQPGNAARVSQLGAGLVGNIQTVTPNIITAIVKHVLDDPTYHNRVLNLSKILQADNTCEEALDFISAQIKTNKVRPLDV
jgi:zeaxanthin glucosyltransferase